MEAQTQETTFTPRWFCVVKEGVVRWRCETLEDARRMVDNQLGDGWEVWGTTLSWPLPGDRIESTRKERRLE
jgi:hypothetical protein